MKSYIKFAIIAALTVIAGSCTNRKIIRELNDVEPYISERPDSALHVLDSLSKAGIQGQEANAKFALLYSMTLDKNHIYLTTDSIVTPAVEYYRNHGTDSDKAKSWYYLGRIQQNSGEYIQAAVSLSNAEKFAGLCGDCFYSGLAHRAIGDIFDVTFNSSEALKYYITAYSDFEEAGMKKHSDYMLLDIARSYNDNKMFDECENTCEKAIYIARNTCDTVLYAECLKLYASALQKIKDFPEPEKTIRIFNYVSDTLKYGLTFDDYTVLANAYTLEGDFESASDIIGQLRTLAAQDRYASARLAYSEYLLHSRQENYSDALEYFEHVVTFQDSLLRKTLQQSLLSAQRDMLKKQIQEDLYRIKAKDRTITVSVIAAVVIISLLSLMYYRKLKAQEKTNADYIRQINEAVRQLRETSGLLQEKDTRIAELYAVLESAGSLPENGKTVLDDLHSSMQKIHGSRLRHLDELCSEYCIYGQSSSRYRRIFKHAEALVKSLSDDSEYRIIESTVNQLRLDIMSKARTELHNLKDEDFRLLCYLYAGFSPSTISLLMNFGKVDIIYTRKSRLKKKIENSAAPLKKFFLDNLD